MTAPYAPGDPIRIMHDCAGHGTELATLTVQRIKALAEHGRWRVTTTRCDGTQLDVEVGADGRDRHDYTYPPSKGPRCPLKCQECARRLVSSNHRGPAPDGMVRYGSHGLCKACRARTDSPPPAPKPAPKPKHATPKRDQRLGTDYNGPGTWIDTRCVIAPEDVRPAQLTVCEWARDVDDARDLLAVCGIGGAA